MRGFRAAVFGICLLGCSHAWSQLPPPGLTRKAVEKMEAEIDVLLTWETEFEKHEEADIRRELPRMSLEDKRGLHAALMDSWKAALAAEWKKGRETRGDLSGSPALDDCFRKLNARKYTEAIVAANLLPQSDFDLSDRHYVVGVANYRLKKYDEAIKAFNECELKGSNQNFFKYRGMSRDVAGKWGDKQTAKDYERALVLEPDLPFLLNNLAWILATSKDKSVRDGEKSWKLVNKAIRLSKEEDLWLCLDTRAAAHAEMGNFELAVRSQEESMKVTPWSKLPEEDKEESSKRLELYKERKPWRE